MNVMIANLSTVNPNKPNCIEYDWIDDSVQPNNKITVHGIQTNEAATKVFISLLKSKAQRLDKILYAASAEVRDNKYVCYDNKTVTIANNANNALTSEAFYKHRIEAFCNQEKVPVPEFIPVYTDNSKPLEILIEQIGSLSKALTGNDELVFYIDTTGGLRDDVNRLQLLAKFLTYKGIKIELALYSNLGANTVIRTDVFDMLDVLDGVNQFTTTGQSSLLQASLDGEVGEIKELLGYMRQFTDNIQLCRVDELNKIYDALENIFKSIHKLENMQDDTYSSKLLLFRHLIPLIKEKFFGSNTTEAVSYPAIVKWCLDNGLVQQALTIYVERIPTHILDNIIIRDSFIRLDADAESQKKRNLGTSNDAYTLYTDLLGLGDTSDNDEREIQNTLKELRDEYYKIIPETYKDKVKNDAKDSRKDNYTRNLLNYKDNKNLVKLINLCKKHIDTKHPSHLNISSFLSQFEKDSVIYPYVKKLFKAELQHHKQYSYTPSFFNQLLRNNEPSLRALLGLKQVNKDVPNSHKKIVSVTKLPELVKNGDIGLQLNNTPENISLIQNILYDYIYVKAMRNCINHAGSDSSKFMKDDADKYYEMGYGDLVTPTLSQLTQNMQNAIDRLYAAKARKKIQ